MARKTLLTENELRQFMKLANLTPIGQVKLTELGYNDLEEEMPPDEFGPPTDDLDDGGLDGGLEDEEEVVDDEMGAEMEMGADLEEPEGPPGMIAVEDFMTALESALEDVLKEPVSTEMDDELSVEDDLEGAELEMDAPGPDELEMTASPEEEEIEVPGARPGMYEGKSQDDIVNEVARRVAKRLQKANSKSAMVDQLAEKILKRLTK
jgi:hypothetical protein|tara:strand:+ start:83 stop:706 length:624 start_codon:yes stop_codon:yes gene_type:complete